MTFDQPRSTVNVAKESLMNFQRGQENDVPTEDAASSSTQIKVESRKRRVLSAYSPPVAKKPCVKKEKLIIDESADRSEEQLFYGPRGHYEMVNEELLSNRYKVIKRLGAGSYAAVYMAWDEEEDETVALKVARCGRFSNLNSLKELNLATAVCGNINCAKIRDSFRISGKHGKHVVLVFDILGPTLHDIIHNSNQAVLSTDRIKKFCRNILNGLDRMHNEAGIIHCDLKPQNMMVAIPQSEAQSCAFSVYLQDPFCLASLKIGDFGLSTCITDSINGLIQTCQYRSPEAFLKAEITPAVDLWSMGCIAYELVTNDILFPCHHTAKINELRDHMSKIASEIGEINSYFFGQADQGICKELFGENTTYRCEMPKASKISLESIREKSDMSRLDAELFCDFLKQLLTIGPAERITADQALKHPFLL